MKEMIKKYRKVIICIVIILIVVLLILGIRLIFRSSKDNKNNYSYVGDVKDLPGTKKYTTPSLLAPHCIESVCIINAKFYFIDDDGRVEYYIENHSDEKVPAGYLKMVFGDQYLVIAYRSLEPREMIKTVSSYSGVSFSDKSDYVLKKLTKKEMKKLKIYK